MTYYKFLTADGLSPYADYAWSLPTDDGPGDPVEVEGELVACKNGIHACTLRDSFDWFNEAMYEIEFADTPQEADNKAFGRSARLVRRIDAWNARTARLLAADFAEHVAHLWVAPEGVTWVPADTISVARRYAEGDATDEELQAAWAAASAARDAARDAARSATAAARSADSDASAAAKAAARSAVWAAASYAASDAAWDAALDVERDWQNTRLAEVLGLESTP